MSLRIGSLFTGTGALDLAAMDVYDAEVVWHSQYEPPDKKGREDKHQYAAKILARHWPDVPNLGDITKVDWQAVIKEHGPIDILTGGFPCQDVSSAGRRVGLNPDSRSGLWTHMARAVAVLQPKLVVIENVEGLLSAPAASDLEPCAYCMGDGHAEPVLRACGAVLGDLASLGLDAEWGRYGADEVGAPHRRRRIIIRAWPAALDASGLGRRDGSGLVGGMGTAGRDQEAAADPADLGHERGGITRDGRPGPADSSLPAAHTGSPGLEVGRVEPDGPQLPATERSRREPAADTHRVEPQRRGVAGVLGGPASAEPGQGDQRERAGDAAGDSREATSDAQSDGRHQRRTEPARQQGRPDAAERSGTTHAEPVCPTCLCPKSEHAPDGLCNGCLHCTDPELGQPGFCPDDCPLCADEAAADTDGGGRERHQERDGGPEAGQPERQRGLDPVGRGARRTPVEPRLASTGETAADAARLGHGYSRPTGQRGIPASPVAGAATARGGAAPADADHSGRRADVLQLRPGQPDLDWGDYGPAIRRWERVLGRRAPWPTDALGRLSPVFTEWLMGLPDGWVTDTPGLTRAAMLRALGNGVVWQQAAHALRLLHHRAHANQQAAA